MTAMRRAALMLAIGACLCAPAAAQPDEEMIIGRPAQFSEAQHRLLVDIGEANAIAYSCRGAFLNTALAEAAAVELGLSLKRRDVRAEIDRVTSIILPQLADYQESTICSTGNVMYGAEGGGRPGLLLPPERDGDR